MKDELLTISLDDTVVKAAKANLENYGLSVAKYLQLMLFLAADNKAELKIMVDKNDLTQWLKRLDAD